LSGFAHNISFAFDAATIINGGWVGGGHYRSAPYPLRFLNKLMSTDKTPDILWLTSYYGIAQGDDFRSKQQRESIKIL
jgi:hypothetical protein